MKVLAKYLKKREDAIDVILKKKRKEYTPDTFHKLRVELKKLKAFFDLIKCCSTGFKQKKTFKPFRFIFRQAGKVRELQVEEIMLKKYFPADSLKDYRDILKQQYLKEEEDYFAIVTEKCIAGLKKKYDEILPFMRQVDKKCVNNYMKKKRNKIEKLLRQAPLTSQIHPLRKQLKKFSYIQKILNVDKANKPLLKKEVLTELLGKWHDCQIIINHIKKVMDAGLLNTKEKRQLKIIKAKITAEMEVLFKKINTGVSSSEFFVAQR